jgi:hypothetical protein
MFNAAPFNTQAFNGTGVLRRTVLLAATVACGAAADAPSPDLVRVRTLGANVAIATATTPNPGLVELHIGGGNVTAGASADVTLYRVRRLDASASIATAGLIGGLITWELSGEATVETSGVLLPFDFLAEGDVTTETAVEADLTKVRMLGASVAVDITSDEGGSLVYRNCYGTVDVETAVVGSSDTTIGGVRYAEFGATPAVDITVENTIDPVKFLYIDGQVETSSFADYCKIRTNGALVDVTTTISFALNTINSQLGAVATGGADATALMVRYANMAASVSVSPSVVDPPVSAQRFMAANVSTSSVAVVYAVRYAIAASSVSVSVTSIGQVKPATRLAGTVSTDVTTSASPAYFTMPLLAGSANMDVGAVVAMDRVTLLAGEAQTETSIVRAEIRLNVLVFEPDYRTIEVELDDTSIEIEPQDFTIVITDDEATMKTFTKQPSEILAYDADFTDWFSDIVGGDDISLADCEIISASSGAIGDLSIDDIILVLSNQDDPFSDVYRVKIWISGGLDGATYKLTLLMDTTGGRRKEVDFKIRIKES